MITLRPSSAASGFTLIEVMLAVAIFSVVLLAINGVFYGAMRLRNKMTLHLEDLTPSEHALAVMKRDFRAALPPGSSLSGAMTTTLSSGAVNPGEGTIGFFTASGLINDAEPYGDAQKVAYYLRASQEPAQASRSRVREGRELVRSVTRNVLATTQDTPQEELLLEGIDRLRFSFYDGSEWRTTWDANSKVTVGTNQSSMPLAVEVTIDPVADDKKPLIPIQFIVPLTIQAASQSETNSP